MLEVVLISDVVPENIKTNLEDRCVLSPFKNRPLAAIGYGKPQDPAWFLITQTTWKIRLKFDHRRAAGYENTVVHGIDMMRRQHGRKKP